MNKYQRDISRICHAKGITDPERVQRIIDDVFCSYLDFSECTQAEFEIQVEASIATAL